MTWGSSWIRSLTLNTPVFSRSFDFVLLQQKTTSFSKAVSLTSIAILVIPMAYFSISCEVICNAGKKAFGILDFFNYFFFPI